MCNDFFFPWKYNGKQLYCNIREQGPWITAKWRNRNCRSDIGTYFKYRVYWAFQTQILNKGNTSLREENVCLYIILPLCQCCSGKQNQHQISVDDPTRKLHHLTPMLVSHSTTITTHHMNKPIMIVNYHFTVQGMVNRNMWSDMFPSIIKCHKVTPWSFMHAKETIKLDNYIWDSCITFSRWNKRKLIFNTNLINRK